MKNLFKLAPAKTLAALLLTFTTAFCVSANAISYADSFNKNLSNNGSVMTPSSCTDNPDVGTMCCYGSGVGEDFRVVCTLNPRTIIRE